MRAFIPGNLFVPGLLTICLALLGGCEPYLTYVDEPETVAENAAQQPPPAQAQAQAPAPAQVQPLVQAPAQAQTLAPPPGPRVNLYPMSAPPPGSLAPLAQSAPPAGYWGAPGYAPAPQYAAVPVPTTQPQAAPQAASPYQTLMQGGAYQTYSTPATLYTEPVPAQPVYAAPIPVPAQPVYAAPVPAQGESVVYPVPALPPASAVYSSGPVYPAPYVGGPAPLGRYAVAVEEVTSTSSHVVPLMDPPVVVDNQYYRSTTAAPALPAAPRGYTPTATPAPAANSVIYTPATPYTPPATYTPTASPLPVPVGTVTPVPPPTTYTAAASPVAGQVAGPVVATAAGGSFRLVPALDVPPGIHPNDAAPSQWFEVVRPGNGPIRIGRVSSTCVCVSVRVPNRHIAAGERALVEARIVTRPPVNNLTYGMYVNILEPTDVMLDADVTITF